MSGGSNIVFSDFKSHSEVEHSEMMKQIISKEMKYKPAHLSSIASPQLSDISVLGMVISLWRVKRNHDLICFYLSSLEFTS